MAGRNPSALYGLVLVTLSLVLTVFSGSVVAQQPAPPDDGVVYAPIAVSDPQWKEWCQGGSKSGFACFHRFKGEMTDYNVPATQASQVVFSGQTHYFGAKCQTQDHPVYIKADNMGFLVILDAVTKTINGRQTSCCNIGVWYQSKFTPAYVCPGDTVDYPWFRL